MDRKLASIRTVDEVIPIENADAICAYRVGGWKVVDQIGKYKVGDSVIYLEIDSWVPHEIAPFLSKGQVPREYEGVAGARLKSIKLRGVVSQGLLLDYKQFPDVFNAFHRTRMYDPDESDYYNALDVTELLGIKKWEPPIPANMAGQMRGNFPTHLVPKTDQERYQNIWPEIRARGDSTYYEVTLKIDGTSCTFLVHEGKLRACSRNIEMLIDDDNLYSRVARAYGAALPDGFAVQGEIYGEGIQGNPEKITGQEFAAYAVYDIVNQRYLLPREQNDWLHEHDIPWVPRLYTEANAPLTDDGMQEFATGSSINANLREGVVFKSINDGFSFKAISNKWLLKNGDK